MTTRATYNVCGTDFYIHYDGYATGAARYFAAMVEAQITLDPDSLDGARPNRGGWAFHFVRGNYLAEPAEGHETHGDTEYRYDVTVDRNTGALGLQVTARDWKSPGGNEWRLTYNGPFLDWYVTQRVARDDLPEVVGGVVEGRITYATATQAATLSAHFVKLAMGKSAMAGNWVERRALEWGAMVNPVAGDIH